MRECWVTFHISNMYFRQVRFLFALILCASFTSTSLAADIRILESGIALSGPIKRGDFFTLRLEMAKEANVLRVLHGFTLNSPGGDMGEAMKIGELVRGLRLPTRVAENGICASACFFIWLGGAMRSAGSEEFTRSGKVGLHRPFLATPSNTPSGLQRQAEVQRLTIQELERQLVPRRLIDTLMSRPSNDIYWLSFEDIEELGEHPPELEELYIQKCSYDRRNVVRLAQSRRSGDAAGATQLQGHMAKVLRCMNELDLNALDDGLERLNSSVWKPRDPFREPALLRR